MKTFSRSATLGFAALACAFLLSLLAPTAGAAEAKPKFKLAWTIYVGWMPWDYAAQSGILQKWADKYGVEIEVTQVNDYVESINQYTAGAFDACVMTNMDALTIPAAGGVDSTALLVGDYSNGNDGVILRGKDHLADIKGQHVNLVELSVSHYLLARALDSMGASEKDIKVVNTSDADIVAAATAPGTTAVVTWNPQLAEIRKQPGMHQVFDSSAIPGEILDLLVVKTDLLRKHPELGKALAGAWYEVLALMAQKEAGKAAREAMAKASGTDLAGFDAQLATTFMFWTAKDATAFARSPALPATMAKVASFSFAHGLLGEGAKSAEAVGMSFPGGNSDVRAASVKLRFDDTWMALAADGKL